MNRALNAAILAVSLTVAADAPAEDVSLTRLADQRSGPGPSEWFTGTVTVRTLFGRRPLRVARPPV